MFGLTAKTWTRCFSAGKSPLWLSDSTLFFREWVRDPRLSAAILPSSSSLATEITKHVSGKTGPVLELGPGTGVFTQALLNRGISEENLTLIEYNPAFVSVLRDRYPLARTLQLDAEQIGKVRLYEGSPVGAVICGLGLLNMSKETIAKIVTGAFTFIRRGGEFFLFTYGPRCPIPRSVLNESSLTSTQVGRTYLNFPPATVYRITRTA